jgi:proprotein convertase subtilisin/kexin type 2
MKKRIFLQNSFFSFRSMILSERPNDDDRTDGFSKWPFMTTHTWGENPRGRWKLEIKFHTPEANSGFIREWNLLLHGTKEAPYKNLASSDPHSKLAMVKKAHEDRR